MSKNRSKIGITIDVELDKFLNENNYNKSKLIDSLIEKWLSKDEKNVENFQKKTD
jgi:hypothetical protein